MNPKVLQRILGHATLQMTMDLYAHILPDMQADEMKLLEDEMNKVDSMSDKIVNFQYEKYKANNDKIVLRICYA